MKDYLEKLHYFEELVSCSYELPFWEYTKDLDLLTKTTEKNELLSYFFRYSDVPDKIRSYIRSGKKMPVFLSNKDMLMWIADFHYEGDECQRVILMGPIFMNISTAAEIREKISGGNQPMTIRRRLSETLGQIPVLSSTDLFQYTIMMHYALTGEKIQVSDIGHLENHSTPDAILHAVQKIRVVDPDPDSAEAIQDTTHQGVLPVSQMLHDAVRTGNMNFESILSRASLVSKGIRTRRGDALRGVKNSIIQFIGLCSWEAIQGGLPASISYTLSDTYTDLIEGCNTVDELAQISHTMFEDYIRRVHNYQTQSKLSRPIRLVSDYIRMYPDGDLTLKNLAKVSGYSEYYLSRKFKTETGSSISDFINQTKVERAKLLLRTSDLNIQDISDQLGFLSHTYFATIFRKYADCSPTEYREDPK